MLSVVTGAVEVAADNIALVAQHKLIDHVGELVAERSRHDVRRTVYADNSDVDRRTR